MVTPVQASASCSAVNSGAFNLANTTLGASSSSILFGWFVGEQITLTLSSSDGNSRSDGFYHGSTFAAGTFGPLQTVTVPATGNVQITHTVVSSDLTNGIAVDPENNDSVSATCTPAPGPAVTGISPNTGPGGGGTSVTITGMGFVNVSTVSFGPNGATLTVNSATQITATAPAGSGTVDVTVTTTVGTSPTSSADQYTYTAVPTVTSVSPSVGRTAGGTIVTISGTNLNGATTVSFGGVSATINTDSATSITATSPAHSSGTVDVTVTTPGGTSATSAADKFSYFAPPTVTAISPTSGVTTGGTTVTITGANLNGATAVSFGGVAATINTDATNSITATSPAHSAGIVDVTVTTPGGISATSAADQFTYGVYRTWVSAMSGNDSNPCTINSPCLTFTGALANTIAGGEINVLSPGDYGPVTVTKAISIYNNSVGEGGLLASGANGNNSVGEGRLLASGANGIVIQAGAKDTVTLVGLDIDGLGSGSDGVQVLSAGEVQVLKCKIHDFTGNGVNMNSDVANSRVFIKDSIITKNVTGVAIQGNGVVNGGSIVNTVVDANTTNALLVNGAGNAVGVIQSLFTASPNGINLMNGGLAISIGQQNVVTGAGAFSSTVAYK